MAVTYQWRGAFTNARHFDRERRDLATLAHRRRALDVEHGHADLDPRDRRRLARILARCRDLDRRALLRREPLGVEDDVRPRLVGRSESTEEISQTPAMPRK